MTTNVEGLSATKWWPSLVGTMAGAFALFFLLDCLLFRINLYPSVVEPDSTTGRFEATLWRERHAQKKYGDNVVITLGDSRFGYSPRVANEYADQSGYIFRNAGVAGTNPRVWRYMLRDLDPSAARYRAVIFGIDDFDDEDSYSDPNDNERDLHYVIVRLHLSDVFEFAASYPRFNSRWEALRGGLLKGFVLQRDMQEFFEHPNKRIDYVRQVHAGFEEWAYLFKEDPRSLAGLEIDWPTWSAKMPPGADQNQRDTITNALLRRPIPQNGHMAEFRRRWFTKILEQYKNSRTKVLFVRLPRGPIPRPAELKRSTGSVLRELARAYPNARLIDEHAFETLEHPELFKDGVHLNLEGSNRFTKMFVDEVAKSLGRP